MLHLFRHLVVSICLCALTVPVASAQNRDAPIQQLLQTHGDILKKSSRKTIGPAIDALAASGLPDALVVLQRWQAKDMWVAKDSGLFVFAEKAEDGDLRLFDVAGGAEFGLGSKRDFKQLKPNSGIRGLIAAALVQFQLADRDPAIRAAALDVIERKAEAWHLAALREAMDTEPDPALKARKARLERLLTIRFSEDEAERIEAINSFAGDLSVSARATLRPLVEARIEVGDIVPQGALPVQIGGEALGRQDAYALLVSRNLAPPLVDTDGIRDGLIANIDGDRVAGVQVATLDTDAARLSAYALLADTGAVQPLVTDADITASLANFQFYEVYVGAPIAVAQAAQSVLQGIETQVALNETADLALDALSILIAIPLAFAVTFGAGVAMERLVIRWLYHRPLETLLATFGVSIALQQLAKNIFGTQARPLTAPDWLDGSWVINDIVSISYIRIAIFGLALLFLAIFLLVMNRTRLGLEVRAVTQNSRMAASIGLYAKVTSEMGSDYIVQSFMTVVVDGVGNIWGTLLGATLVGTMQKGIEWFNPSNTLAAQTYMILFIILFIQFRPRGIIALKGRAAEA